MDRVGEREQVGFGNPGVVEPVGEQLRAGLADGIMPTARGDPIGAVAGVVGLGPGPGRPASNEVFRHAGVPMLGERHRVVAGEQRHIPRIGRAGAEVPRDAQRVGAGVARDEHRQVFQQGGGLFNCLVVVVAAQHVLDRQGAGGGGVQRLHGGNQPGWAASRQDQDGDAGGIHQTAIWQEATACSGAGASAGGRVSSARGSPSRVSVPVWPSWMLGSSRICPPISRQRRQIA